MTGRRLDPAELRRVLTAWPPPARALAMAARDLILRDPPGLDECVAFGALRHVKTRAPYGVIGGHGCPIERREDHIRLAFLHGASLPDPGRLLHGRAKAKRGLDVHSAEDLALPALATLLRAAVAHDPSPPPR